MKKRLLVSLMLCLLAISNPAIAGQKAGTNHPKTIINDQTAKQMLLGKHRFSLQWISWDYFGSATVTETNGTLSITGEQRGRGDTNYVKMDGIITRVDAKEFGFNGTIIIQVKDNNNGEPCKREGEMTFRITNNRRYWRLKEMDNPCEGIVDYVDIYFRAAGK